MGDAFGEKAADDGDQQNRKQQAAIAFLGVSHAYGLPLVRLAPLRDQPLQVGRVLLVPVLADGKHGLRQAALVVAVERVAHVLVREHGAWGDESLKRKR